MAISAFQKNAFQQDERAFQFEVVVLGARIAGGTFTRGQWRDFKEEQKRLRKERERKRRQREEEQRQQLAARRQAQIDKAYEDRCAEIRLAESALLKAELGGFLEQQRVARRVETVLAEISKNRPGTETYQADARGALAKAAETKRRNDDLAILLLTAA